MGESRFAGSALLALRLRHLRVEGAEIAGRNAHLIGVALFVFGLPLVYHPEILGLPILDLFRPVSAWRRSAELLAWLGMLWGWVALIGSAARGAGLWRFARSLPIEPWTMWRVDAALAALAMGIGWIPLLAAALGLAWAVPAAAGRWQAGCLVGTLALAAWALTQAWIARERRGTVILLVAAALGLAAIPPGSSFGWRGIPAAVIVFLALRLSTSLRQVSAQRGPRRRAQRPALRRGAPARLRQWLQVETAIQSRILFGSRLASTLVRILLGSFLSSSAAWQVANNTDGDAGRLDAHVFLGIAALILAGMHRNLVEAGAPYAGYLRGFPRGSRFVRIRDHLAVLTITFFVLVMGLLNGGTALRGAQLGHAVALGLFYSALTSLLGGSWVTRWRLSVEFSAIIAALWMMLGFGWLA